MSAATPPIKITKNKLQYIASDVGQPFAPGTELTFLTGETKKVSPTLTNGAIYFATKDSTDGTITINGTEVAADYNRAYIFLDDNDMRYAVTGPVDWSEILNKPLNSILSNLTMATTEGNLHKLELRYLHNVTEVKSDLTLPFVLQSGDTMTGALNMRSHIYLTGATSNTSQIVFGTSSDNHVAISSNPNALIINPSTTLTTNQIVLYLNQQASFPKGINAGSSNINAANFIGLATKATKDSSENVINATYIRSSYISDIDTNSYTPLVNTDGHTLRYKSGTNADLSVTQNLPFVLLSGDTMTGALTIARDNSTTSPRVSLDYNDVTDSLDFTFA